MSASSLDHRLSNLLLRLSALPNHLSDHPNVYPFSNFSLTPHDIELYGSAQGALNHNLQLVFGSRFDNRPIEFRGRGSSLLSVVDVLNRYITGEAGENVLLWKWVEDLTSGAVAASVQLPKATRTKRKRRAPQTEEDIALSKRIKVSTTEAAAAKAATAIKYPHDPADLEDEPEMTASAIGRSRNELLDKVTKPCRLITDPSVRRYRCRGEGCGWSWAEPRSSYRVLKHTRQCAGLDPSLRQESEQHNAATSLAARIHTFNSETSVLTPLENPEALRQKTEKVNHALLKLLCDRMIPPSVVDCPKWKDFVHSLDENIDTASGSTIAVKFVTTEAAFICGESIKRLSQLQNLTLSFDGGTTRGGESVYTVHVTDPLTREAHLVECSEETGVSHTAEHIRSVLDK
ncbi:hypothetical protein BDV93DRAFT_474979, partial [Ceratobasidium sp. AG-I]